MVGGQFATFNILPSYPPFIAWHMRVKVAGVKCKTINGTTACTKEHGATATIANGDICLSGSAHIKAATEVIDLGKIFDDQMRAGNR